MTDRPNDDRTEPIPPDEVQGRAGPVIPETRYPTLGELGRVTLPETSSGGPPSTRAGSPGAPADRSSRYQILGEIARGGMGAVLRGHDPELGRELAIKVLLDDHRDDPRMVRRFVEEAQIAGQLQHPGVAPVHEIGTFADGTPYFAMKLVKGQTLAALLGERGDPSTGLDRFLPVFEAIAQTMAYAHSRGVIHRDLKPSNVMVGGFGEVQVMDWGLAKVLSGAPAGAERAAEPAGRETVIATARSGSSVDASTAGSAMGTPAYMAPEQAAGEVDRVDRRADVFGLGAILCEILTGRPPHAGRDVGEVLRRAIRGDVADAHARLGAEGVDPELAALARHCLAPEPVDRPADAGDVARTVTAIRTSAEERARKAEIDRVQEAADRAQAELRAGEERKRRRVVVALALTGALALATGGVAWRYVELQRVAQQVMTAGLVNQAIGRAQSLRDLAATAPVGEPAQRERASALWRDVLASADQAEKALAGGSPSAPLRDQAVATLATIRREAADADRDRTMLDRLEDARLAMARLTNTDVDYNLTRPYIYGSAGAGRYASAFRDYGIDLEAPDPGEAARRIRARPIRRHLVAALDNWSQINPASDRSGRLLAIADAADDDEARKHIRAAVGRKDRPELLRLAAGPEAASLSPQTALLLAAGLETAKDTNDSAGVLRRALDRHPDDFWLNDLAGLYFLNSDPPRPVEALAAFQAALAAWPENTPALTNLGMTWNVLGDFGRAAETFTRALERDRQYLLIRDGHFQSLVNAGNLAGAQAAARDWVRDEPASPAALGALAYILSLDGSPEESERLIQEAVRHPTQGGLDLQLVAQRLASLGKYEDALPRFRQFVKLAPNSAEAARLLGTSLILTDRADEGMRELKRAVELSPRSGSCWSSLALGLASQGRYQEALEADGQAIRRDPFQPSTRSLYAYHLRFAGKFREALVVAEEAVRLGPRDAHALAERGRCLANLGRHPEAIQSLKQVIGLQPRVAAWRRELGDILKTSHDPAAAVAAYKEAIALQPDAARLHNALGNAYFELGDYPHAIEAYRLAILRDGKYPIFRINLANTLRLGGRGAEAIEAYREAIAIAPTDPDCRVGLAGCYFASKEIEKAVVAQQEAVELNRGDASAARMLGIYLRHAGRAADSLPWFEAAIKIRPDWASPLWAMGRSLEQLGRHEEAILSLRRAEELLRKDRSEDEIIGWQVFHDLGVSLREAGRFAESLVAFERSKEMAAKVRSPGELPDDLRQMIGSLDGEIGRSRQWAGLDGTLSAIRAGTVTAAGPAAALELADFALRRKDWPATAAKLFEGAFASGPGPAAGRDAGHRAAAARAAARASAGLGGDAAQLEPSEKGRLRKLALDWLRGELAGRAGPVEGGPPADRAAIARSLGAWRADPDLAAVRDAGALARLPEAEREPWRAFWAEVDALIAGPGEGRP